MSNARLFLENERRRNLTLRLKRKKMILMMKKLLDPEILESVATWIWLQTLHIISPMDWLLELPIRLEEISDSSPRSLFFSMKSREYSQPFLIHKLLRMGWSQLFESQSQSETTLKSQCCCSQSYFGLEKSDISVKKWPRSSVFAHSASDWAGQTR